MREENYKLRAKIQQFEEESAKKNKIMQELMAQLSCTVTARVPTLHKEVFFLFAN